MKPAATTPDHIIKEILLREPASVASFMKERIPRRLMETSRIPWVLWAASWGMAFTLWADSSGTFFYIRSNEDLDIVVEGDGITFAKKYAAVERCADPFL